MLRSNRSILYIALFVAAALTVVLFLWRDASAQDGCTVRIVPGGVMLSGCRVVTATPTRTPTHTPTPAATATPTPAATALGPMWAGGGGAFYSDGQFLRTAWGGGEIIWQQRYGADQEAFITLVDIDRTATGAALILASAAPEPGADALLVRYSPMVDAAEVWLRQAGAYSLVSSTPAHYADGDQFGARLLDGRVTAYRNGQAVAGWTLSVAPAGGYAGIGAQGEWVLDDWGAGDVTPEPGA